jgi:peptide/nickel transport system substrate-binding protein
MKFRLAMTLAAASTVLLAAACSSSPAGTVNPSAGSTIPLLRLGIPFTISTLDEAKNIGATNIDKMGLETLLKFGSQGQLEPVLATSWAQTSPVTYVYHLRQGVTFWDGHPLTAVDVAYSLNYNRAAGSQVAFAFTGVKSITATDRYTVTVTLTQPEASWQYVPAELNSYVFERQFAEAHKATLGRPGTLMMGTGPWKVDSLDPIKSAELSANPHWWGGTVPIQKLSFTFFSSETSLALAFRAGEIDLDPGINAPKSFAAASGAKLLTAPSCGNSFFGMNVRDSGWNDVHVRRAVAYALNRIDIIAAQGGYASPIYTMTPPSLLRSVASQSQINALLGSIPLYQYNLAKAKQEIAESAYPHGFSATITSSNDATDLNVNQVIAAELAKIGIKLQIKPIDVNAWTAMESGPASGRSTALSDGNGCFQPDPGTYGDFLGSANTQPGGWNFADYAPPAVDTLLAQGTATSNPAQRFAVYSKLFQRLQADEPYVGLFVSDYAAALSPSFTWPGFNPWIGVGGAAYPLGIKRTA